MKRTQNKKKEQASLRVVGTHLAAGLRGPTSPLPGSSRQAGPPHPSSTPPRCQRGRLFVISDLQAGTTLHRSPFGGGGRVVVVVATAATAAGGGADERVGSGAALFSERELKLDVKFGDSEEETST